MTLNFTSHAFSLSRIKLIFLVLLLQCTAYGLTFAQGSDVSISGKVTNSENGEPLPGVTVLVKGTTTGTVTDIEGNYKLNPSSDADTLVFSYIGFETKEEIINGQSTINVALAPDVQSLSEVVVVGYGEQSRETLTSSISQLDSKVLENVPLGNAATALQGTVSGVRVQQLSGQPGASPRVVLRGGASINDPDGAEPLYVVDGVQRQDLQGINTDNIKSIQVLKDASATAIYGARAANGVVIVETKRGVQGQTIVNYNSTFGIAQLRKKLPMLNAREAIYYHRLGAVTRAAYEAGQPYIPGDNYEEWARETGWGNVATPYGHGNDLTNETLFTTQWLTPENQYLLDQGWESMPDPVYTDQTLIFKDTDWQDVAFQTAFTQDHNLSISGGSENATFRLGVGFMDSEGITILTGYQRFTSDLDGRVKVADNLSFSGGVNFSQEGDNRVWSDQNVFERSVLAHPATKYRFEDGTLAPGYASSLGNIEYHLKRYDNTNNRSNITLRGGMDWEILPGLTFRPTASLYIRNNEEHGFHMSYDNGLRGGLNINRDANALYSKWRQNEFAAVLNYKKEFADVHNLDATFGSSYLNRDYSEISAAGRYAATDLIPTLNASGEPVNVHSLMRERRLIGYFGRVNYNYNLRYLLTITGRYDGATNLGAENKWGFFPAISAGWNLHHENFWNDPFQISKLKLRASYGASGNLGNLSDYQALGEFGVGGRYNGVAAITYNVLSNPALRWEESTTVDLGMEAGFFDNNVSLIFNYYRRVTDKLITTLSLPASTGFADVLTNLGSLENRGVEMEFNAYIINTSDWGVNLAFNASRNENKILKLPENGVENNRIGGFYVYDSELGDYTWKGGLQEGGSLGEMYAFQQTGVYATQEEAAQGPLNTMRLVHGPENYAGDAAFLDKDGNGEIDLRDRVYVGSIYPDWTGGVSASVRFKDFNLYTRADYAVGHTINNYVRTQANGTYAGEGINSTTDLLRSWQNPGDQTDISLLAPADQSFRGNTWMNDPRRNGGGNSIYYEKGDYLALREVTLSYNVPGDLYKALKFLSNLRINITGNNLTYITDYTGLAPEIGGWDRGRYPLPRQIIIGINATF